LYNFVVNARSRGQENKKDALTQSYPQPLLFSSFRAYSPKYNKRGLEIHTTPTYFTMQIPVLILRVTHTFHPRACASLLPRFLQKVSRFLNSTLYLIQVKNQMTFVYSI